MSKLFETTTISSLNLKNRFIRSATWEGMAAKDGACTQKLIELMVQLAQGGVGLIITGHAYVSPEGQAGPWQLGIYRDDFVDDLKEMTESLHAAGGKIVMQLAHAGCHANSELSGQEPIGPSVMENEKGPFCREMSREDIQRVIAAFGQAALRAQEAGFDGVQIHAAHGYLLSQFLSPFYNKRSDDYGGSFENRTRIVNDLADYISLSRPLIREPNLVNRWKSGDTGRATCQSDNLCFKPGLQGEGIYCVTERKLRDE